MWRNARNFQIFLVLLGLCILTVGGCAAPRPTLQQAAAADYGVYPENYQEIIKAHLNETLFDPYSIRDLRMSKPEKGYAWGPVGRPPIYGYKCFVSFNCKNRMGGYIGKTMYYTLIRNGKIIVMEDVREIDNLMCPIPSHLPPVS